MKVRQDMCYLRNKLQDNGFVGASVAMGHGRTAMHVLIKKKAHMIRRKIFVFYVEQRWAS